MAREKNSKTNNNSTDSGLNFEAQLWAGYDDISRLISVSIAPMPKPKPYVGRWETEESGEPAIFLFGRGRDEE